VTSRPREVTTRSRWPDAGRDVRPRELDVDDMMPQSGVDDEGDQFLVFSVNSAPWTGGAGGCTGRKTKVWQCIDRGNDNGDLASTSASRRDRADDAMTCMNHSSTTAEHIKTHDDRRALNIRTHGRIGVDTRLSSTGQSPSSPLSPASPQVLSHASRPSAIPVRVSTNNGKPMFHFHFHLSQFYKISSLSLFSRVATHYDFKIMLTLL